MRERVRVSHVEVVVFTFVLSVVAVGIVPKFAKANTESRICNLVDGLEIMRTQLDLYRVWHDESFPPCDSFESFETAMTTKIGKYGPYVKNIPVNPFNGLNTVRFDGGPAGANKAGWRFDTETGLFQADNSSVYAGL